MGLIVTYACATMGIIGMWLVPSEYDFGQVLGVAMLFFDAQKSGIINAQTNLVPWRGDSGLNDTWSDTKSLIGGYYDGGDHIKYSYTIATTVTFLSWSVLEFGKVRPAPCTASWSWQSSNHRRARAALGLRAPSPAAGSADSRR